MDEERGDRLAEILRAARHAPRAGWRERALAAMGTARPSGSRWGWVPTAVGVALVIAALGLLPYSASAPGAGMGNALAAQQAMAAETLGEMPEEGAGRKVTRETLPEGLRSYAERAPDFVREHHPDDPEMLMAAGLLTRDIDESLALLKAAVDKGESGAAWAAYTGVLMETGPAYNRLATWAVDPEDPEAVTEAERKIAESGVPQSLTPKEAEPVLNVLKQWREAEPRNALPVALEMYYLYGLHRDREALERWEEAGRLPEVDSHYQESITATARLLERMGMSQWDALSNSYNSTWMIGRVSKLRQCARIGVYEGRLAEMQGRAEEAVRWWMGTVQLGRHMQQSADTLIECLVGIAIEGIGGWPVWEWRPDRMTGIPDGPLQGGRLFHGVHHDFFVAQAGEQAAEQVRDSMARAKVRSMLSREYVQSRPGLPAEHFRSAILRAYSISYGVPLVACLLVLAGVSVRARKRADEATSLSWPWRMLLSLLALAPVSIAFALMWLALHKSIMQPGLPLLLSAGMALSFLSILLLPLLAALRSRTAGARLVTAWRGNLRSVLPVGIVVLAVVSLALGIAGRRAEAEWARTWLSETEMDRVVREIGPEWLDPEIPPDAWRAEPPPMVRE